MLVFVRCDLRNDKRFSFQQRLDFVWLNLICSEREFQKTPFLHFAEQQQHVLTGNFMRHGPPKVKVRTSNCRCPNPRQTPRIAFWSNSVVPKSRTNFFDQSAAWSTRQIFCIRHVLISGTWKIRKTKRKHRGWIFDDFRASQLQQNSITHWPELLRWFTLLVEVPKLSRLAIINGVLIGCPDQDEHQAGVTLTSL